MLPVTTHARRRVNSPSCVDTHANGTMLTVVVQDAPFKRVHYVRDLLSATGIQLFAFSVVGIMLKYCKIILNAS